MEVVRGADLPWVPSPTAGIERRILARRGGEVAVATSIVRYAPGSRFPSHRHDLGEEYLVLDGVFSDRDGDHPAGTYVRNPPGTAHAPWSDAGCTIFVRLRQFHPADLGRVVCPAVGRVHRFEADGVQITVDVEATSGTDDEGPHESFVLDGPERWTWARLLPGERRPGSLGTRLVTRSVGFDPW